ncbi:hypothetical protein [Streptomyces sp. NPDC057877]|uniref:hypothetical protein n=1 Tax=Streptomyces sp. NPDC057877 TaxID=3346269 RepID=UPI00368F87BC
MGRTDVIAAALRHPRLLRPLLAHELGERLVQGLAPRSTVAEWTATVPQLAEAIDTALDADAAAAAARAAGSGPAGHPLVILTRGCDLVGVCGCGRPLGRIVPGRPLDALAVPWERHTGTAHPHTA